MPPTAFLSQSHGVSSYLIRLILSPISANNRPTPSSPLPVRYLALPFWRHPHFLRRSPGCSFHMGFSALCTLRSWRQLCPTLALFLPRSIPSRYLIITHPLENFMLVLAKFATSHPTSSTERSMGIHSSVGTRTVRTASSFLTPPPSHPDSPFQLAAQLALRSLSHIPAAFRPNHLQPPPSPSLSTSCYHDPITFSLRTAEREGTPTFYGHAPILHSSYSEGARIGTFSPHSPTIRKLFAFQKAFPNIPNCSISYGLCPCGTIHAYLSALSPISHDTPLHVGDPPYHESDFILQFDGGAYRTLGVGGAGVVLWQHSRGHLTFIDSLCIPLSSCPDAAHAEAAAAAGAVQLASKHFPRLSPARIVIKGDNKAVIDL